MRRGISCSETIADDRLYMGASTALNVVAAEMMAKELGAGNTIVTILCGNRPLPPSSIFLIVI